MKLKLRSKVRKQNENENIITLLDFYIISISELYDLRKFNENKRKKKPTTEKWVI